MGGSRVVPAPSLNRHASPSHSSSRRPLKGRTKGKVWLPVLTGYVSPVRRFAGQQVRNEILETVHTSEQTSGCTLYAQLRIDG